MSKRDSIYDLDRDGLNQFAISLGLPIYRGDQIWDWLYRKYTRSFDDMTNLPMDLRGELKKRFEISSLGQSFEQLSADGQTRKLLFQLSDGNFIEAVLMQYEKRRTLCISSQAGCAMGCVFCATGQMGFLRNLSVAEIVEQVIYFASELAAEGERVTNIVFMGMGEPFHNYENTLDAVDRLTDPEGFGLGARKITISTVGLVPAIYRYADEQRQSTLAISLHAATNEERSKLIPIARRWPLGELLEACRYYVSKTSRRLTFEWALIDGENDGPEQAHAVGELLQGLLCHVNLIPLNPTANYGGRPSTRERVSAFQRLLQTYGISSSVRVRRGIDIQAGCGQLRDRFLSGSQ